MKVLVALGGNALILPGQRGYIHEQRENILRALRLLLPLFKEGHKVILTHGNGPQVGQTLLRTELTRDKTYPLTLDFCNAQTQGEIGYLILNALHQVLREEKVNRQGVAVITRVVVDINDPAFKNPTKPVGSFMTEEEAKEKAEKEGWVVKEDAGRGWRRVVPSPDPKDILEKDAIKDLFEAGYVVVAVGGGGIPVAFDSEGNLIGVEAVIDKDLASSLMASFLDVDLFLILTQVPYVYLNFNKPDQRALKRVTLSEAKKYLEEGHFAEGSMKPKIKAVIRFLQRGGRRAAITSYENALKALAGEGGTQFLPD